MCCIINFTVIGIDFIVLMIAMFVIHVFPISVIHFDFPIHRKFELPISVNRISDIGKSFSDLYAVLSYFLLLHCPYYLLKPCPPQKTTAGFPRQSGFTLKQTQSMKLNTIL